MGSATVSVAAVGVSQTASAPTDPYGSSFAQRNVFGRTPKTAGETPRAPHCHRSSLTPFEPEELLRAGRDVCVRAGRTSMFVNGPVTAGADCKLNPVLVRVARATLSCWIRCWRFHRFVVAWSIRIEAEELLRAGRDVRVRAGRGGKVGERAGDGGRGLQIGPGVGPA